MVRYGLRDFLPLRRSSALTRSMALIVVVGLLFGVPRVVGALGGGPITPLAAAQSLGVPEAAVVDVGDGFAAAVPVTGGISVRVVSKVGGEVRTLTTAPGRVGQPSAHLLSPGGADVAFNSYFYGTADGRTSRVSVSLPGSRWGSVVAGTWLVATHSGPDAQECLVDVHGT